MPELEQSIMRVLTGAQGALSYAGLPLLAAVGTFIASAFALGRAAGAFALNIIAAVAVYWLVSDVQATGVSTTTLALAAVLSVLGYLYWHVNMSKRGGK